ncbi:hypothetical protein [Lapidilactobacillus gannanensis]|uniref:Uncharacterized protein n=1 Tax=Lapidilactobacillus gannanensis TaxID=2486002 RepID=A0ABW4BPT1_9LACO|nr:hypothetical protein [Lapidilactobacillus gannanensis]
MNFGLLLIAGITILLSCFAGMLTYSNWRTPKYRHWFLTATTVLVVIAVISSWFLLQH